VELIERLEALSSPPSAVEAWSLVEAGPFGTSGEPAELFAAALGGSLDAALALAERVLPDFWWIVRSDERGGFANVGPNSDAFKGATAWPVYAATPALALCLAILRATNQEQDQ
jgi:hypothetical protein